MGQAILLSSVTESAGSDLSLELAVTMTISTFIGLGAVYVLSILTLDWMGNSSLILHYLLVS